MKSIKIFDLEEMNARAANEGWMIVDTKEEGGCYNRYELQSIESTGIFENDDEAIRHVSFIAMEFPESFHADAIHFLCLESPNEIDSIFRTAMDKRDFEELCEALFIDFHYGIKQLIG
jgi:hypothetical protein